MKGVKKYIPLPTKLIIVEHIINLQVTPILYLLKRPKNFSLSDKRVDWVDCIFHYSKL